ncbi:hypothetical protein [Candidatus Synechococcus spongiarum]|uniref:Uncharacterized protein n=1 Tax=Candidatus Synechococcus spongiarum TaxID=431041 RepID=A0A170TAU0_9SYNE|nr:hypothetical protein [Candidatus Synechococcus spongiarum]CZB18640.1 hypothetical protein FLM9_850 [Candidatus Synechococcus spongiarum]
MKNDYRRFGSAKKILSHLSHRLLKMKDSSLTTGCFSALNTTMLSVGAAFALSLGAPAALAGLDTSRSLPLDDTLVKTAKGPTCLSWEDSFKEMAIEFEDWSDLDAATCDGFAGLVAEEEILETAVVW